MGQIKAELLESFDNDLGVVNSARVSMGKTRSEFDASDGKGSDSRLVKYLINSEPVPHFAPLCHGRVTFRLNPELLIGNLNEIDLAGLVFADNGRKVRHSVFGWANLINKGLLYPDCADAINFMMLKDYPNVWPQLVNMPIAEDYNHGAAIKLLPEYETDLRFIDATFRLTSSIPIARQEFKHIVSFIRSEESRRYVSDDPEFLEVTEWRSRPKKSIKQGSGGKHKNQWLPSMLYWLLCKLSAGSYNYLVSKGYAPEQLRGLLLQNMMTQYIVTGSLSGFKRMLTQRLDDHAQLEIRELAGQINEQLSKQYGELWDEAIPAV